MTTDVTSLMRRLISVAALVLAVAVAAAASASAAPGGSLTITATGLPSGQQPSILLTGPRLRRVITAGHVALHGLRPGHYLLTVRPVVVRRSSHAVRSGATVFPAKRRLGVTLKAGQAARVVAAYGAVVNPGVRSLPRGLLGIIGSAENPTALVLSSRSRPPGVGTILTSGPTTLLPVGLISKVTRTARQHGRLVVSLTSVPITDAVPELSFEGALQLTPAHGAAQEAGSSIPAQAASAPRARRASACGISPSSSLLHFGAHLDSVELRQASLGAWPPQMKMTLAVRTTETLGLGIFSASLDCTWPLAEIGPFNAAIPVGPLLIPVYAALPLTVKLSLSGSVQAGSINVASTTVAHVAAGFDENAASLSEQGSNVWSTGPSVSGSASLSATIGVQAGVGIAKAGNLHVEAAFGPEFDASTGHGCDLHIDLGSLSAGTEVFGQSLDTPSFTPFKIPLWSGCKPKPPPPPPSGGGGGTGGGTGGGEVPKKEEGGGTEKGGGETPGGVWSTRESFDPAFLGSAISCPTSSFCVAVDAGANASIYNGSTWSAPQKIGSITNGSPALDSISCVSEHFCVAAGYRVVVTYDNGSWNAPQTIDPSNTWAYLKVSCASETLCIAVDLSGFAWKYTGTWSGAQDVDQGPFVAQNAQGFNAVSCPTTTFCAAVDSQGQGFTYSNGKWGEPIKLNTGRTLSSVSCSSGTRCDAVDVGGNVYEYNGGAWGAGVLVDSTLSANSRPVLISCPYTCVLVDGGGNAFMQAGGKWSGATEVERATDDPVTSLYNGLNGISCQSATSCVAIDVVGNAFVSSATNKWAATPSIGGGPDHVSCAPATTFCAAVDGTGRALTYTSGKWSAPVVIDGTTMLNGVSCATATFCVAVDEFGGALVYNGSTWTRQVIDSTHGISGEPAELVSVSCVSEHDCVAIDHEGNAVIYSNGSWGEPESIFGKELYREITAISCYSAKFCMVVDAFGEGYVYNGTTWTQTGSVDQSGNGLRSVSCPSEETCIAADGLNDAFHYHGVTWTSEPVGSGENFASVKALSCPTTGFCVAVGVEGDAYIFNGSTWLGPDRIDPLSASGAPIYPSPSLESVSCSSTTSCMATDFSGGFFTY